MKKIVIFYFSGTGNTWWVSETLANYFEKHQVEASAISIEKISHEEADSLISTCDIVGFGYPIHGSDLPLVMKEFIESLSPVNGKATFVFCTQWLFSGDGARVGRDFLNDKGFDIGWAEHFFMPNNVCITAFGFLPYTNNREKIEGRLKKTRQRIEHFANSVVCDNKYQRGFNTASLFLGAVQRVPFRRMFHKLRDLIRIDDEKCINCDACVKLCPTQNFVVDGSDIKTKGVCITCLRCYNFCPVSAIIYMDKPHGNRKKPYQGPVENFNPAILK